MTAGILADVLGGDLSGSIPQAGIDRSELTLRMNLGKLGSPAALLQDSAKELGDRFMNLDRTARSLAYHQKD